MDSISSADKTIEKISSKEAPIHPGTKTVETISSEEPRRAVSWGWLVVFGLILGLLFMLAIGLQRTSQGPIRQGDKVPNFALTTFEGDEIQLADLKGKVVVLNFWASWCKPCEQEARELQTAWEMYQPRGDVMFLGADYVDTEPEAMAYLEKFQITYPNGPDLGTRISQTFRIRGVPETYFIDKNGVLAHTKIGPFTSLGEITSVLDNVLEQ